MIQELTPFYEAADNPAAAADTAQANGRKAIGYLCSYAPEELIFAAGCHPMRLFSSKSDISLAENHLQAYCCSLVRGILEDGLAGRLDYLDGTVFPHTCDSIQRLSDIWRLNISQAFFADVVMPVKLTTASAKEYMKEVLEKLKSDLEGYTGKPISQDDLANAFALFNRIRKNLDTIYTMKSKTPGILSAKDLFTVIKGSMIMDRELLDKSLIDLVSALNNKQVENKPFKRVLLSGSICDMPDLYSLIEDAGGTVVGDDLCSGQRWFQDQIQMDIPAMDALTARYTDRVVCPAKHSGNTARGDALVAQAKKADADGIIFTLFKFCDPHAFDFPYLKSFLDDAGFPLLHLEMDDQQINTGQMATRIETFIHMI
ncbi:MAG: 2-hydroxyacyl-CoA dehydratase family protein [Desulfobacterales bacterium]|nr:2-hydroxyacyl-CoA dehydratase family protein [Desulfobacterales bacterium]